MSTPVTIQRQYDLAARTISGTRDEKLEQIDDAIQELLDIKVLECASEQPNVRFLAVPRRSHWFGVTVTLLAMMALLLLLGVRAAHAQAAGGNGPPTQGTLAGTPAEPAKKADPFAFADFTWLSGNPRTRESPLDTKAFTGEFRADINFTYSFNKPADDTIVGSSEIFRSGEFQVTQLGVGVDFHHDNVQGRLMTQFGMPPAAIPARLARWCPAGRRTSGRRRTA